MTSTPSLHSLENMLGVQFHDKALLQQAFVHRSYLNELLDNQQQLFDNERLEFLRDAVLSYIFSEYLYTHFPAQKEGGLTNLRSALVRRETLARLAVKLHLGSYLLLGHGEEESGGRSRQATLCATFEALVGALYLDQQIEVCRDVVIRLFRQELHRLDQRLQVKDAKSRLQELAQSRLGATPRYRQAASDGPDHAKHFIMVVQISGTAFGVGQGRSKQEATQNAAAMALYSMGEIVDNYTLDRDLARAHDIELPGADEALDADNMQDVDDVQDTDDTPGAAGA